MRIHEVSKKKLVSGNIILNKRCRRLFCLCYQCLFNWLVLPSPQRIMHVHETSIYIQVQSCTIFKGKSNLNLYKNKLLRK